MLESPQEFGCNTSLPPGQYRDVFAPAHLVVAAVLIGCLWSLGENRIVLGVAAAVALLSAAIPLVLAPIALVVVVVGPYLGPPSPPARATRYALVLLLPASAIFAYLRGASILCF